MTPATLPVVAVVDASPDTLEMLRAALRAVGILAATALVDSFEDPADFADFLTQHEALAVIYDIPRPYEASWQRCVQLRRVAPAASIPFIFTSTDANGVRALVGASIAVHQIFGKPYELDAIVHAVKKAASL